MLWVDDPANHTTIQDNKKVWAKGVMKMFCEEMINKVYTIEKYESQYEHNKNAFLSFSPELEWHVTEGYWLGFETDNHFLLAGYDGVKILDSKEDLPADEYDVYSDDDFFGYESTETTIFKGERILDVAEAKNKYIIHLDHFDMTIFVYHDYFDCSCGENVNIQIKAAEHCVKRKCSCGGTAEVVLDFVSDFGVRCKKCHLSTYHTYVLQSVIDDWEKEVDLHVIET